jgi:hypothetical protein
MKNVETLINSSNIIQRDENSRGRNASNDQKLYGAMSDSRDISVFPKSLTSSIINYKSRYLTFKPFMGDMNNPDY